MSPFTAVLLVILAVAVVVLIVAEVQLGERRRAASDRLRVRQESDLLGDALRASRVERRS